MCKNHQLEGLSIEFYEKPKKLVFLLHGYGDNSHNFITLANYLVDSELSINFYIPDAPLSVPQYPSGRQWFDLYPNGIYFNEAGEKEKKILEQDCLSSLKLIKVYIDNLCNKFNLNYSDCFILGFSQGSMVTFEFGK